MTRELVAFQDALIAESVATRFLEAGVKTASVKEPLYGHDSMATAYLVDDYPYGFRLRCKIRYWVEYVPKKGYRMVSQTTNPKIADREVWNKPKACAVKPKACAVKPKACPVKPEACAVKPKA